jgi:hypothetical protein
VVVPAEDTQQAEARHGSGRPPRPETRVKESSAYPPFQSNAAIPWSIARPRAHRSAIAYTMTRLPAHRDFGDGLHLNQEIVTHLGLTADEREKVEKILEDTKASMEEREARHAVEIDPLANEYVCELPPDEGYAGEVELQLMERLENLLGQERAELLGDAANSYFKQFEHTRIIICDVSRKATGQVGYGFRIQHLNQAGEIVRGRSIIHCGGPDDGMNGPPKFKHLFKIP